MSDVEGWSSNTDVASLASWLSHASPVVLLTHQKPDGDALGSTLALARALKLVARDGPAGSASVLPFYVGPLPRWGREVIGATKFKCVEPSASSEQENGSPEGLPEEVGRIVVLDTGTWSQLAGVRGWLRGRRESVAVIDHHLHGDADVGSRLIVDTSAAAVCEPVAMLCCELLGVEASELPEDVATPLYLGLATDTGWFRHSNVTPRVFRLAASLLEAGVDHSGLYSMVEQRDHPGRLRLLGRALAGLELLVDGRLGMMTMSVSDFTESGALPGDSGGFGDAALGAERVMVSAVLTEVDKREAGGKVLTKVSLRSKACEGSADVNQVAMRLGGGGHARAAGARVEAGLEETKRMVEEAVRAEMA